MRITVQRTVFSDKSTIGQMLINDRFFAYTLEDVDRKLEDDPDAKVYGETAIPRGVYKVDTRYSPHFKAVVPWLKDVPGYEWVLIHWGNKPEDTDGCILVGDAYADDWISHSRATWSKLMKMIDAAIDIEEDIMLEVV
jgi:hypothetical protein